MLVACVSMFVHSGSHTRQPLKLAVCTGFSAAHIGLLAAAGSAAGMGPVYFGGLAVCTAHLGWQVSSVDLDDPQDCMSKFVSNQWYGGMLFATIVADRLMGS
jgi:4-hydroxybenzoate polyprenyltransferase